MPFELCNVPTTFEMLMDMVLRGWTWKTCLVYLESAIDIGKFLKDQLKTLKEVITRIRNAQLKENLEKYILFQKEVQCLGHLVSLDGVRIDPN